MQEACRVFFQPSSDVTRIPCTEEATGALRETVEGICGRDRLRRYAKERAETQNGPARTRALPTASDPEGHDGPSLVLLHPMPKHRHTPTAAATCGDAAGHTSSAPMAKNHANGRAQVGGDAARNTTHSCAAAKLACRSTFEGTPEAFRAASINAGTVTRPSRSENRQLSRDVSALTYAVYIMLAQFRERRTARDPLAVELRGAGSGQFHRSEGAPPALTGWRGSGHRRHGTAHRPRRRQGPARAPGRSPR